MNPPKVTAQTFHLEPTLYALVMIDPGILFDLFKGPAYNTDDLFTRCAGYLERILSELPSLASVCILWLMSGEEVR